MAEAPAPETATQPVTLFTLTIATGSEVTVRGPRVGERGTWRVTGEVATTSPDDPAYDVTHTSTGRRRIFRASRLIVVRSPQPSAPQQHTRRKPR